MSAQTTNPSSSPSARPRGSKLPMIIGTLAVVVVVAAMALDTKVVRIGTAEHVTEDGFSPEAFGAVGLMDQHIGAGGNFS